MIDPNSETWRDVIAHIETATANLVNAALSPNADERTTMFVRGQYKALCEIRNMPKLQLEEARSKRNG